MLSFASAVKRADATGLPVVEGLAVRLEDGGDPRIAEDCLAKRWPEVSWSGRPEGQDGWWVFEDDGSQALSLGQAWEAVRELEATRGITEAEPLLLTRLPTISGTEGQRFFPLWGRASNEQQARIRKASGEAHRHWSLAQLGVTGKSGAWSLWKQRHPERVPGDGILIAHPDTGYTAHDRLLSHLEVRPEDPPGHHGRNFVERELADAGTNGLDQLVDRLLGPDHPGHGTGTASVLAASHEKENQPEADQPWGVAPGVKVLPLRVSTSVIHLSFRNLCDAFQEAIDRKAHVISMSLGGPVGSKLLRAMVRRALDQGILVVAAAGNYAPTVVFPARLPGVIACAASNALATPWRFSGLGEEVVVTAPGELVWHDRTRLNADDQPIYDQINTSGTSFAAANVAGLAALWLSYHGRDELIQKHCGGRPELLPFLFRFCLQESADGKPKFVRKGDGGFGAGIARANKLLKQSFPSVEALQAQRVKVLAGRTRGLVTFPASSWSTILTLPTLAGGQPRLPEAEDTARREERLETLLKKVAADFDAGDGAELGALVAADPLLGNILAQAAQGARGTVSAAAVRRYLLRRPEILSATLHTKLTGAWEADKKRWQKAHPELTRPEADRNCLARSEGTGAYRISPPSRRRLRVFAFDPSLATSRAAAAVNEVTLSIVFERELSPGPVGDYLEVVDVDPASDCVYAPVDLDHPYLLAQDGLPRSEGNPQFHQQMVYAVAMKTIGHFEEALGRPLFWSPLRPWNWRTGDADRAESVFYEDGEGDEERQDESDQFIQRLRLYPHALRDQNAYYSPDKRAILFGYFPAGGSDPGTEVPGGVVFTCLAHDIIAHEMTHAILDGMHVHFTEPTNPDVFAFHEAFADLVALFQRFSYQDLLRDQIARARGRLDSGTLLTRLGLQFGGATGRRQALRDALGLIVEQARQKGETEWRDLPPEREIDGGEPAATLGDAARDLSDRETRRLWKRYQADPWLLGRVEEPHERGSILVAAVFDAYLTIYADRVADLKRIATGGTGILPDGDLHPDLVDRMAREAAKAAHHVLRMCLRAMDYVPPIDITFGEFLRALITADHDLVPDDNRRYRVAFIEAFRKWGIYPRHVRTLSEDSLRWSPPPEGATSLFPGPGQVPKDFQENEVRRALLEWQPGKARGEVFDKIKNAQRALWTYLRGDALDAKTKEALLGGIDTRCSFQVTNLRPARRIGPGGDFLTEMVVEVLQSKNALPYDDAEKKAETARRKKDREARIEQGQQEERNRVPFRGGVTLIVSLNDYSVRYAIYKRVDSASREARQNAFRAADGGGEAAEYSSDGLPSGWFTRDEVRKQWLEGRHHDAEHMRSSSCACRRTRMEAAKTTALAKEPFALLHRS